jgi:hypothetical protein
LPPLKIAPDPFKWIQGYLRGVAFRHCRLTIRKPLRDFQGLPGMLAGKEVVD